MKPGNSSNVRHSSRFLVMVSNANVLEEMLDMWNAKKQSQSKIFVTF